MKLLLDTHVFLWYITADPKLPATFRTAIQDPANEVYLSVASIWEASTNSASSRSRHRRLNSCLGRGKLTGLPAWRSMREQCHTWPACSRSTAIHSIDCWSHSHCSTG
jgi:hypothetical protein